MKRIATFILLTFAVVAAWAAEESVTFSAQSYSNEQEIASYSGRNFSITFDKGSNSNAPKYYTSGSAIRAYGGNYFTITSSSTITQIVITFSSGGDSNEITTDVGTYSNGTWTGSSKNVKFTIGGTSGHRRLSSITVTYETGSSGSGGTTVSTTISDYATAHNWVDATQYTTLKLDNNITLTANGSRDTGKYYTSNKTWRFYHSESGTLTITAAEGCTLKSATLTFKPVNSGKLLFSGSEITSEASVTLSGTSATFSVSTSSGTSGQIFFTEISVTYEGGSTAPTTYTVTCQAGSGGSLSVGSTTQYEAGASVTVTATPNTGYELSSMSAYKTGASGTAVELSGSGNTRTFTMPAYGVTVAATFAQSGSSGGGGDIPSGYYDPAKGKCGQELLTALYNIIKSRTTPSYEGLWTAFKKTDIGSDGKIIDMYSDYPFTYSSDQCGNYSHLGACYNREHSFPKSWWGGGTNTTTFPYADLFHLYPTDGYVNNQRSNYPFGECSNGTRITYGNYTARGRLGTCTFSGYSGTVFEPDDIYKGDFARTYFYIATCYNNLISGWSSNSDAKMLAGNSYPVFTTWATNLLLKWHRNDAVSEKETTRNEAVYGIQDNRNPFIDHPEFVEYIWGNQKTTPWYPTNTAAATLSQPTDGGTLNFGNVAAGTSKSLSITVKGSDLTEALTVSVSGQRFSCAKTSISAADANAGTTITVVFNAPSTTQSANGILTISSSEVSAELTLSGQAVSGIVASEATEIGYTSFVANWEDAGIGTMYQLYVYQSDGTTAVSGYPVSVTAANGAYTVTELQDNTTYYYQLKCGNASSNVVEVKTNIVVPMLAFQNADNLEFELDWNKQCPIGNTGSPILEASVFAENVSGNITLALGGDYGASKFEISLDRTNWSSSLTLNSEGETFYLRVKDITVWGSFQGVLTASAANVEAESVPIIAYIIEKRTTTTVVEDFEEAEYTTQYGSSAINGSAYTWGTNDILVAGDKQKNDDRYNGTRCVRMGNYDISILSMTTYHTGGATGLSFLAAPYGTNTHNTTLTVYYRLQGETNWHELNTFTLTGATAAQSVSSGKLKKASGSLVEYEIDLTELNITDPVQFRFTKNATGNEKRVNIDDITITKSVSERVPTSVDAVKSDRTAADWCAYPQAGGVAIESAEKCRFYIYNLDAREMASPRVKGRKSIALPAGVYIVTDGQTSRKVIVR